MEGKEKVVVKPNKKCTDYICKYPNRNGRILGNNIFTMIQQFEDWKGAKLTDVIRNAGYDPNTLKITVKTLKDEK